MYEIRTDKYQKEKKILMDGKEWIMRLPGAGDELALAQAQRRVKLLDKKIEDGTATEVDYDLYDKLENRTVEMFTKVFIDGSKDNEGVRKWLYDTPLVIIYEIFEDIKKQAEDNEAQKDSQTQS